MQKHLKTSRHEQNGANKTDAGNGSYGLETGEVGVTSQNYKHALLGDKEPSTGAQVGRSKDSFV